MQRTLRLTITAVGEPDSVFLTPCEPITLHETIGDQTDDAEQQDVDEMDAEDASAIFDNDDFYVVIEPVEVPMPRSHRRAS